MPVDANGQSVNVIPQAATGRKLPSVAFAPNALASVDLPTDTTLQSLEIYCSGSVVTTFASGTPVADSLSILPNLVAYFQVQIDGGRIVKSVDPAMLRFQQLLTSGIFPDRRASAGASAVDQPTTSQGFVYGTTGQVTTIEEAVVIEFSMPYCEPGTGRELTWLQLKDRMTATLKIQMNPFAALLGYGNTAPVVYSASTIQFEIVTKESQYVPEDVNFFDFRQTYFDEAFSAQASLRQIKLELSARLAGIMLFARNGAAGSTTTASGKLPSDLLVNNVILTQNGRMDLVNTSWKALQYLNRHEFGYAAPVASSISLATGMAYMNLINRKNLDTALDCTRPVTDSLYLKISTNASSVVSYTDGANLRIGLDEIVNP